MTPAESDALRVLARCYRSTHGGELLEVMRQWDGNEEVASALETLGPVFVGQDRGRN